MSGNYSYSLIFEKDENGNVNAKMERRDNSLSKVEEAEINVSAFIDNFAADMIDEPEVTWNRANGENVKVETGTKLQRIAQAVGDMFGSNSGLTGADIIHGLVSQNKPTYFFEEKQHCIVSDNKETVEKNGKTIPSDQGIYGLDIILKSESDRSVIWIPAVNSKLFHLPFTQSSLEVFGEPGDRIAMNFDLKSRQFVPSLLDEYLQALTWVNKHNEAKKAAKESGEEDRDLILTDTEKKIAEKLKKSKNIILHGAPGTGKTYMAKRIAEKLAGDTGGVEFVQFHPSYDYTDFVEGLRPDIEAESKDLKFVLQDGIFKEFVKKAQEALKKAGDEGLETSDAPKYVFIIDEINRGEISKIFGELFFSIDTGYRKPEYAISTQYANINGGEKFYIPENVYIIGTMNDIDRSVDSFDFAMRRRFRFIEVTAENSKEALSKLEDKKLKKWAEDSMDGLNRIIAIAETPNLGTEYQIGASYYLKLDEVKPDDDRPEDEKLKEAKYALWLDYIEPLLSEYLRGFPNKTKDDQLEEMKAAFFCEEASNDK